jgi:hypothetical protein
MSTVPVIRAPVTGTFSAPAVPPRRPPPSGRSAPDGQRWRLPSSRFPRISGLLSRTVLDKFRICRNNYIGKYLRPFPFPCGFRHPASVSFLSR